MIKSLVRMLVPDSLRQSVYQARQRPWKRDISQWCQQWCQDRRSDESVHAEQYAQAFGKPLDLKTPRTFNEKLHWLSLNYQLPIMTKCADKYAVRDFVTDRGCGHLLNELYGAWDTPEEITFGSLPAEYIMKVNHGSGQNFIRRAGDTRTVGGMRSQLAQWMKRSEYWHSREWAYKDIQPKIICERLLKDVHGNVPPDYKFFCFNGEPHMIQVDTDRFTTHHRDLFDLEWKRLPFSLEYAASGQEIPKPETLESMISAARALSQGFPFVRVDFYAMGARVIFGEMTWYPAGGLGKFTPDEYDAYYGEMLSLPQQERP